MKTVARETAVETAPRGRTTIVWEDGALPGLAKGTALPARWYKETLEPASPGARVVARFEDGAPAAIVSRYGRGRTLLLGSYVSAAYQSTPTPGAERFFAALLDWAGVAPPIEVSGSPLEARHLESGREALLVLFNHGDGRADSTVRFGRPPGSYDAIDLVTGDPVALEPPADAVRFRIGIERGGVRVVRIAPRCGIRNRSRRRRTAKMPMACAAAPNARRLEP